MSSLGYLVLISACLTIGLIMGRISSVSRRVHSIHKSFVKLAKFFKEESDRLDRCFVQMGKMADLCSEECKKVESLQKEVSELYLKCKFN